MKKYDNLFGHPKKKHHKIHVFFIILIMFVSFVFIYNYLINSHALLLNETVTIPSLPNVFEGYRILHISDLHGIFFGSKQENILSALENAKYNIVCVTGDITDKNNSVKAFLRLKSEFPEEIPVLFVPGDEDPEPINISSDSFNSIKTRYIQELEEAGIVFLDAPYEVNINSKSIWFMPESLYTLDLKAYEESIIKLANEQTEPDETSSIILAYHQDRLNRIMAAKQKMSTESIQIILTHVPIQYSGMADIYQTELSEQNAFSGKLSLILSGHYNNGQWAIPYLGPIYIPKSFGMISDGFFSGLQSLSGFQSSLGITQYISPGLGNSNQYPFPISLGRLFNQPAVTILTLTTKLAN